MSTMARGVALVCFLVPFVVIWAYILSPEFGGANQCDMTYMRPSYIKVPLPGTVGNNRGYEVYLYREALGRGSSHTRELEKLGKPSDDGKQQNVPVFFLPGNSGSYKQVRSLGSESHGLSEKREKERQEESRRREQRSDGDDELITQDDSPSSIDWFSLNFNEELSAFHAGLLKSQTMFTLSVITHIFSLYPPNTNRHVIIVGHSMGGIVARNVLLELSMRDSTSSSTSSLEDKKYTNTLIPLATPHVYTPATTTPSAGRFHDKLNQSWRSKSPRVNTALVSITGGDRDRQVRWKHANVDFLVGDENVFGFATDVRDLPGVRQKGLSSTPTPNTPLSADHQCIVWCNQVVVAVAGGLLDVVGMGGNEKENKSNASGIRNVLKTNLVDADESNDGSEIEPNLKRNVARFVLTHTPSLAPLVVAVAFGVGAVAAPRRRVRGGGKEKTEDSLKRLPVFISVVLTSVLCTAHPALGTISGYSVQVLFKRKDRAMDTRGLSRLIAQCIACALTIPSLVAAIQASIEARGVDFDLFFAPYTYRLDTVCAVLSSLPGLLELMEPVSEIGEVLNPLGDVVEFLSLGLAAVVSVNAFVYPSRVYRILYAVAIDGVGVCLGSLARWSMRRRNRRGKTKTKTS